METQPKPEAEPTINGRPLKSGSPTAFVYNGLWHDIRSVKGRENSHTCSRNRQASVKPISETQGDPEKGISSPKIKGKWHSIASEFFNAPGSMSPFYRRLCATIQTADMDNTARLRKGFPELVEYVKEGV